MLETRSSDRKQAEMSLALLKEGLIKAEKVFLDLRLEARSSMEHAQYWTLMGRIGEKSMQVRSKEQIRLHRKEVNLKKRGEDCQRHILCRWMRIFCKQVHDEKLKKGEPEEGKEETGPVWNTPNTGP